MRLIPICVAALLLAGCVNTGTSGTQASFGSFSGSASRPKTVVVSDFVFASEVVALDRSFTARLERKIGTFPTYERKIRTIIATLREAGLDAQPGSEEGLSLGDDALLVSGRARASDQGNGVKKDQIGFGAGRSGVVADMTISHMSGGGKKQLLTFMAEPQSGRKAGAAGSPKAAAANNAAITAALVAEKAATEKLSADVEAQARKLGRAAGEKIVAYAREQGWLTTAEATEALAEEKPVKRSEKKPAKKPEKPDNADSSDT
jgi:hypothetical protein